MTSLAGRHVCITGGSEGIGLAVARLALERGARVSLIARRLDRLDDVAVELGGHGVAVAGADVTDADAVTRAVDDVGARLGPIDVLVTSAGYAMPGYFAQLTDDDFRRQMDVNYFGTLHAVRAVAPAMVERGDGHLVLVSSTAGLIGVFGYSAYSPTKFAVRGLGEVLRSELKPSGVRVSVVYPPDTETPGFATENLTKPPETAKISGAISARQPAEVARAIVTGIERDKLTITGDTMTAVLARGAGLAGPLVRMMTDRDVASVRDGGPELAG